VNRQSCEWNFTLPPVGRVAERPRGRVGGLSDVCSDPPPPTPPHKGEGCRRTCRGNDVTRIKDLTRRRSRELRNGATPPERLLWQYLRFLNQSGLNFRRQAPIGTFIADFADYKRKLVIELDGDTHASAAAVIHDSKRDEFLRSQGFRIIRVTNSDVTTNLEGVVLAIMAEIETSGAHP
jgi:very-short-patch-repair endonuclease